MVTLTCGGFLGRAFRSGRCRSLTVAVTVIRVDDDGEGGNRTQTVKDIG